MGRKPTFTSAEEMQEKIDAYFASCERELLRDGDGTPMLNKNGEPIYVGGRPMTIQGLALALGFTSRQSLLNYKAKREFVDTVTRARLRVEQYAAERLFDRDAQRGAQFTLAYGFGYARDAEDGKNRETQGVKIEIDRELEESSE
nr:MAG TPA: DNA packaging protein gp3 [Caudoviricetes sp.]